MVDEVIEIQAKSDAAAGAHDAAKFLEIRGLAIGGEAHDFVFIAEFAEAEILRDGAVINSERMRESDRAVDAHAVSVALAPHGAGEISQAVGG